ncbi:MAG: superfamily, partial [bacterium]|nr:superfamily [bacterium]
DYTLALYHQRNLESLSIQCTLDKLIAKRGYPEEIRSLDFDPAFAVRGLVVDRRLGNIFKADRYGHVGRVFHGRTAMSRDERHQLYRLERIRLSSTRYAWIDTLFALPEAVMYSAMIDYFEKKGAVRFGKLWQYIIECIDEAHRDESMKRLIKANLADYIVKDPELAPTLHKFRSSGKKTFLLTNSAWDYTDAVMKHLLDQALPAYPNWRSYFDIVICAGSKPAFFTDKNPFLEIDAAGNVKGKHTGAFSRNRIYQGGNIHDFEKGVGVRGDHVLYIGDHIYGDMLRAKKSSVWRTAMILQELESELTAVENNKERLERVETLERQLVRLDSEISYQQMLLKSLQKLAEQQAGGTPASKDDPSHEPLASAAPTVDAAKVEAKRRLDELRAALKAAADEVSENDRVIDRAFNPYWGAIFREAAENSRFGQQVEDYACVYTSRVSNFLAYSPLRYFRSPRDHMPHELV